MAGPVLVSRDRSVVAQHPVINAIVVFFKNLIYSEWALTWTLLKSRNGVQSVVEVSELSKHATSNLDGPELWNSLLHHPLVRSSFRTWSDHGDV